MKKFSIILFCAIVVFLTFDTIPLKAVEFDTGAIVMYLNDYGKIRLYTSDASQTIQIDRTSPLVGMNENAVFDYAKDADTEVPAEVVADPQLSDFELYGVANNIWSGLPPDLLIATNIYGWTDGGYSVIKLTITSQEAAAFDAIVGLENIAELGGVYGFEIVDYLAEDGVISIHKDNDYVGYKWLSADLISLRSFEWYDGYNDLDSDLWDWLNYGQFDATYQSGVDGAVAIPAQDFVNLPSGGAIEAYFGMAYGRNEDEMLTNIGLAEDAYNVLSVRDEPADLQPNTFALRQNYPNPFNPSTTISFSLPSSEPVQLKVFNQSGSVVALLVDGHLGAGTHRVEFRGDQLPTGIYFYQLQAGQFSECRKMLLMK